MPQKTVLTLSQTQIKLKKGNIIEQSVKLSLAQQNMKATPEQIW